MRRIVALAAAGVVAASLAALSPGQAVPPGGVPATVRVMPETATTRTFPVFDAAGRRVADRAWTVTHAGGNCCEVYVAATPSGRLLEFGGSYPAYSDDRGQTWRRVAPATPVVGGEGAISAAPGGDVVGIGWDPYGGDHLQAFHYDGESREWTWSEVPLHEPFYDRPWIAVVPGTFPRPDGSVSRYATVVRSNWLSSLKETFLVSYDGLTYVPTTARPEALLGRAGASGYLDPASVPALDYAQPHRDARLAPTARGTLLDVVPSGGTGCPAAELTLQPVPVWACYAMPDHRLRTSLVVDSRGWLHEIATEDGSVVYGLSADGGRTWRTAVLKPPRGVVQEGITLLDHKAHGAAGVAAVAAHVGLDGPGSPAQDVVFRVDVRTPTPRFVETVLVGSGDSVTGRGIASSEERFDFASVAILPDGAFAVAFHDATSNDPALAVEQPCARGRRC